MHPYQSCYMLCTWGDCVKWVLGMSHKVIVGHSTLPGDCLLFGQLFRARSTRKACSCICYDDVLYPSVSLCVVLT